MKRASFFSPILGFLFCLIAQTAFAQQNSIRGRIVDNEDIPLIGATIIIKSSPHIGTVTDLDGNFSLTFNQSLPVTIVASLIGYKTQEIDVYDSLEPLLLTLPENVNLLNEVVVTALGINREKIVGIHHTRAEKQ